MSEFTILGQQTSLIEVLGFITGVTGVWLTVRQNILCFPVGIINVSLYAIMFSSEGIRLYADTLLQCIYLFLLIYGWIHWKKSRKSFTIPAMTFDSFSTNMIIISFIAFISLSLFLQKFTNASLPWLDSALTILSLVAQWMVAKKIITNWVIWIIVNIVYIPLYFYKGLPLTSALYFIFLILAIKGYYEWKKEHIKNQLLS
jgi:nicotinamide mononucleotide transporter